MRSRHILYAVLLFALSSHLSAAAGKVESIGAFDDPQATPSLRSVLQKTGYGVRLRDGSLHCEIWFRSDATILPKPITEGAIYRFSESELIGVIRFPKPTADFRNQQLPAGSYTMRYEVSPNDGNHLGASATRDFVLLIPVAADKDPHAAYKLDGLVSLSSKASGTSHPAPMALASPGENSPLSLTKTTEGFYVFSLRLKIERGEPIPFAIIVEGSSPQS